MPDAGTGRTYQIPKWVAGEPVKSLWWGLKVTAPLPVLTSLPKLRVSGIVCARACAVMVMDSMKGCAPPNLMPGNVALLVPVTGEA
jgi:hypothetical protein